MELSNTVKYVAGDIIHSSYAPLGSRSIQGAGLLARNGKSPFKAIAKSNLEDLDHSKKGMGPFLRSIPRVRTRGPRSIFNMAHLDSDLYIVRRLPDIKKTIRKSRFRKVTLSL